MGFLVPLMCCALMGSPCPPDTAGAGAGYIIMFHKGRERDLPAPMQITCTAEHEVVRFRVEVGTSGEMGKPDWANLVVACAGEPIAVCNVAGVSSASCIHYDFSLHRDFVGEAVFSVGWELLPEVPTAEYIPVAPDSVLATAGSGHAQRVPQSGRRFAGVGFELWEVAPRVGD